MSSESSYGASSKGMQPAVHEPRQAAMHLDPTTCKLPCKMACNIPCDITAMHHDVQDGMQINQSRINLSIDKISCKEGYTLKQICVLATLIANQGKIMPYKKMSEYVEKAYKLTVSDDSVRGVVARLTNKGLLSHKQKRQGEIRGVSFILDHTKICSALIICVQANEQVAGQARPFASTLNLKKIDEEDLSIYDYQHAIRALQNLTDSDFEMFWPQLKLAGFGENQIRQIINRRNKINMPINKIMESLEYANWELENGKMIDGNKNQVKSPANWLFKSLLNRGYYRRPEGYISSEEQALKYLEADQKALDQAYKKAFEASMSTWLSQLSEIEHTSIVDDFKVKFPISSEDTALYVYFKNNIWPGIYEPLKSSFQNKISGALKWPE